MSGIALTIFSTTLGAVVGGAAGCCCIPVFGCCIGVPVGGAIGFGTAVTILAASGLIEATFLALGKCFEGMPNLIGFVGKDVVSTAVNHPFLILLTAAALFILFRQQYQYARSASAEN